MWHVTRDMFGEGGEHSLKVSAPKLLLFVIYDIMKIWRKRLTDWIDELMTRLFIEQPQLHRNC